LAAVSFPRTKGERRLPITPLPGAEPPISIREAAPLLSGLLGFSIGEKLLRRMAARGEVPCLRLSGAWLFWECELRRWASRRLALPLEPTPERTPTPSRRESSKSTRRRTG
jgi:hypothetical protein